MNLLKKQGFFNSITLYIGTALGFFNLIILFQRSFTAEEIGFFFLMISVTSLYTQFAAFGFNAIITRYIPYFKSPDGKLEGFPTYVLKITSIGFLVVTLLYVFGKEFIIDYKVEDTDSSYYYQFYYLIIPVAFFTFWFGLAETFARTTFHNIYPSFLREVLLKILTSIGVILLYFNYIHYQQFVYWYILSGGFLLLLLLVYMKNLDLLRFKAIQPSVKEKSNEMLRYGVFSMLSGSSVTLVQNIDTIMLKIYTDEAMVGYYGTLFTIAVVINLPARALSITSYQLIADAWKTNDLPKINKIYSKTSLVQFMIGTLLLIGLIANWHNILVILNKPEYTNYYAVFAVVALGFLVDITGGLNGAIIGFSKNYKVTMYFLLGAAVICALLNMVFIPKFGIVGAALAYSLTTLSLNFAYWLYLLLKFGLQPFNFGFVKVILAGIIALLVGVYLPYINNFFVDIIIRSGLVTLLYVAMSYYLKTSLDINDAINQVIKKLKPN